MEGISGKTKFGIRKIKIKEEIKSQTTSHAICDKDKKG